MVNLSLLPQPRSIGYNEGQHLLKPDRLILLQVSKPLDLLFSIRSLQTALEQYAGIVYPLRASSVGPAEKFGIVLRQVENSLLSDQGYQLVITPEQITLEASTEAGIFYGINTLIQIIKQSHNILPCLTIADWPDFPVRGFMLDISRDKVPTLATLFGLVDKLASWKINQLQLYTEHTFVYLNHPDVWKEASPFTGQDILELDLYCKERFIELVPNQNSFAHMQRWLKHPPYAELSEVTDGFTTPWGYLEGPFSLDPSNPASFELVRSLYDELLPHFTSRQINIGCDETFDLGQGKNKQVCEEQGTHKVYLDFVIKLCNELIARGYTVQMWGDIILEAPELIPQIPEGVTGLVWGYEADHPFELQCSQFEAANIPFYVCPGTSSWCSLAGRSSNAIGNLVNAAEAGLKHGANGYLITDWGDLGHWQTLPVSYLGIVTGAALAWSFEANKNLDVEAILNQYAFEDAAEIMGKLAYDLGNVYQLPGLSRSNASKLFWLLQYSPEQLKRSQQNELQTAASNSSGLLSYIPETTLKEALELIDRIMTPLEQSRMAQADAELVKREYQLTANLMRLACRRGLLAQNPVQFQSQYSEDIATILDEYKQIWLSRNRTGGLSDSIAKLEKLRSQ